jgi:hypothetical protein
MGLKLEKTVKIAIILALILNSAIAVSGFYTRTYDSYGHMLFADHYQRSWFNTWEPKWYMGFDVAGYPPLAHQAMALLGFATGLETAYVLITLILMVLLPIATFRFAKVFVSKEAAGYAALVSVLLPGLLYSAYVWGQFTTIFSLVATLFTVPAFYKYVKEGGFLRFAELIFLFEVVVASHHFTGLIFAPLLLIATLITVITKKEITLRIGFKRFLFFAVVGLLLSIVIVYPVLFSAVSPNVNIPHPTTTNYFQNLDFGALVFHYFERLDFIQLFFINMYGFFLLLIPLTVVVVRSRRELLPLFALSLFLLLLGLGGTTPLPQLVFGQNWLGLTYERFNLFASLAFAPLLGLVCFNLKTEKLGKTFVVVLLVLCLMFSIFAASYSFTRPRPEPVPVDSLVNFLNRDEHWRWRYLTLGFDASEFNKLSVYSNASTIDGWYYRGRNIPEYADSGVGYLSGSKFDANGMTVLRYILGNSSQYHLRFVFCNDAFYEPLLKETGFGVLGENYSQVTVWVKYDSAPLDITEIVNTDHPTSVIDYAWGVVPMSWFLGILLINVYKLQKNRKQNSPDVKQT